MQVTEADVLSGRGGRINAHPGNVRFRAIISSRRAEYLSPKTKKLEKAHIAAEVVREIRDNHGGRFLKQQKDGYWEEIGDAKAIKKVGQALREDCGSADGETSSNMFRSDNNSSYDHERNSRDYDFDTQTISIQNVTPALAVSNDGFSSLVPTPPLAAPSSGRRAVASGPAAHFMSQPDMPVGDTAFGQSFFPADVAHGVENSIVSGLSDPTMLSVSSLGDTEIKAAAARQQAFLRQTQYQQSKNLRQYQHAQQLQQLLQQQQVQIQPTSNVQYQMNPPPNVLPNASTSRGDTVGSSMGSASLSLAGIMNAGSMTSSTFLEHLDLMSSSASSQHQQMFQKPRSALSGMEEMSYAEHSLMGGGIGSDISGGKRPSVKHSGSNVGDNQSVNMSVAETSLAEYSMLSDTLMALDLAAVDRSQHH